MVDCDLGCIMVPTKAFNLPPRMHKNEQSGRRVGAVETRARQVGPRNRSAEQYRRRFRKTTRQATTVGGGTRTDRSGAESPLGKSERQEGALRSKSPRALTRALEHRRIYYQEAALGSP